MKNEVKMVSEGISTFCEDDETLGFSDPEYSIKLSNHIIDLYQNKSLPRKCFYFEELKEGKDPVVVSKKYASGLTIEHSGGDPFKILAETGCTDNRIDTPVFDRLVYKPLSMLNITRRSIVNLTNDLLDICVKLENKDFLKLLDAAVSSEDYIHEDNLTAEAAFDYFSSQDIHVIYEDSLSLDVLTKIHLLKTDSTKLVPYSAVDDEEPNYFYIVSDAIGYMFEHLYYTPLQMVQSKKDILEFSLISNTGQILTGLNDVIKIEL